MQPRLARKDHAGMTLFEVGIVVAVVFILLAVFLPLSSVDLNAHSRARKIACINNLKQTTLAYKIWEGDHDDIFPMGISVTNNGSMEMVATGNVVSTFIAMTNELSTPKILFCYADASREPANTFTGLSNSNISYFVSADVTNDVNPQMILAGDSDLMLAGKMLKPGLASLWTNDLVTWSGTRHQKSGNFGMADGSVQQLTLGGLQTALQQTGLATNRLALP